MDRRAAAGLFLCALLLGLAWPLISALPAVPAQVLGGGVYVVTQGTGSYSINDSLAQNLSAQPWAQVVSPEIFSLGTLGGSAVVVRGVDPRSFLAIEDPQAAVPATLPPAWALAGDGLAVRLGLATGDLLTLVGSGVPRLDVLPLAGEFHAATAANDELLVDFGTARFISGVGAGIYHSIRVKTVEPAELLGFLGQRGASVYISGPSGPVGAANTAPLPPDPRILNLLLRYGIGPLPANYLTEGIAEATNSVQVVAWGLEILIVLLVALGVHAVQARSFAERRPTVGVLRSLGAPATWIRARALRELLPISLVSGAAGSLLGFLVSAVLTPSAVISAFGHDVRVTFDPVGLLAVALAVVAVSIVSELALLEPALRERPTVSIRREPLGTMPRPLEAVLRE